MSQAVASSGRCDVQGIQRQSDRRVRPSLRRQGHSHGQGYGHSDGRSTDRMQAYQWAAPVAQPVVVSHMHLHHHVFLPSGGASGSAVGSTASASAPLALGTIREAESPRTIEEHRPDEEFTTPEFSAEVEPSGGVPVGQPVDAVLDQRIASPEFGDAPFFPANPSAPSGNVARATPPGLLGRAGATLLQAPARSSSFASTVGGDNKAQMRRSQSMPSGLEDPAMNTTAHMWTQYQRSKSVARTRQERQPGWSTSAAAGDGQEKRIVDRLNKLNAQDQWHQNRNLVQRQFREIGLGDPEKKRRLVGDPRLHETRDRHHIAKLKAEDIQRDRDRGQRIKGVMQECSQQRHQLMQMQHLLRGPEPEEEKPAVDTDFLSGLLQR